MAGIEAIALSDLNDIMQQNQNDRTVSGTTVMKFGAEGPEPLCENISPVFAEAARDPSLDVSHTRTLDADTLSM